jgi:hypothetical protein
MVDGTTPQVDPLVAALALNQRTVEQMLRDHVDDATGHCAGCNADAPTQSLWPCGFWRLAELAQRPAGHR